MKIVRGVLAGDRSAFVGSCCYIGVTAGTHAYQGMRYAQFILLATVGMKTINPACRFSGERFSTDENSVSCGRMKVSFA